MDQSLSWKGNSHSAGQEIFHLLWKLTVHYHVHKSLPLDLILSQLNSVRIITPSFFKDHFNATLPSMPRSPISSLQVFQRILTVKKKFLLPHPTSEELTFLLNIFPIQINKSGRVCSYFGVHEFSKYVLCDITYLTGLHVYLLLMQILV